MKKLFSLLVAVLIAMAFISCKPEAENNYIEGEFVISSAVKTGFGFKKDGTYYVITSGMKTESKLYQYTKEGNRIKLFVDDIELYTFEYHDSYIVNTSSKAKYYRNDGSWDNENTNTGGGNSSNSGTTSYISGTYIDEDTDCGYRFTYGGEVYTIYYGIESAAYSYTKNGDVITVTHYDDIIMTFEYHDSYITDTTSGYAVKYYKEGSSSTGGNTEGAGGVDSPSEESGSYISGTYIVTSYGVKTGFKFTSDGKVYEVSNEKKQYLGEYTMSGNKINVPNLSYDIYYYDSYIVVGMLGLETEVKYYKE